MKNILFTSLLLLLVFTSCKKSCHCECEIVSNQGQKYTSVTSSFKATTKEAEEACNSQAESSKLVNQSASCKVVPE